MIGAGPAGLGCTYRLRRLGHQVRLVDSATALGGMMRFGIPSYRLPRDILDAEIERIIALGVDVVLDHPVEDIESERADGAFDAVFVAVGAQLARRLDIPSGDSARVLDAISLLHQVADGDPPQLGLRVAVYGGGDTAIDARARPDASVPPMPSSSTAGTVGACPHTGDELDEALAEGVTFVGSRWSTGSTPAAW